MTRTKPDRLTEVEIMDVIIELDVEVIPADPQSGFMDTEYQIYGAWIGNMDVTDAQLMDDLKDDIYQELDRRRTQVTKHRMAGSYRGVPAGEWS